MQNFKIDQNDSYHNKKNIGRGDLRRWQQKAYPIL